MGKAPLALAALSPEDLATLTAYSGEGDTMSVVIAAAIAVPVIVGMWAFAEPSFALCLGVFLAAWIGKKWLDYRDALVE